MIWFRRNLVIKTHNTQINSLEFRPACTFLAKVKAPVREQFLNVDAEMLFSRNIRWSGFKTQHIQKAFPKRVGQARKKWRSKTLEAGLSFNDKLLSLDQSRHARGNVWNAQYSRFAGKFIDKIPRILWNFVKKKFLFFSKYLWFKKSKNRDIFSCSV